MQLKSTRNGIQAQRLTSGSGQMNIAALERSLKFLAELIRLWLAHFAKAWRLVSRIKRCDPNSTPFIVCPLADTQTHNEGRRANVF
jgi:hypothetical protein